MGTITRRGRAFVATIVVCGWLGHLWQQYVLLIRWSLHVHAHGQCLILRRTPLVWGGKGRDRVGDMLAPTYAPPAVRTIVDGARARDAGGAGRNNAKYEVPLEKTACVQSGMAYHF